MTRIVLAIYIAAAALVVGYFVDEYCSANTLQWYSKQKMYSHDDELTSGLWIGTETPDIDSMIYLTAWRFLDNFLPSVSEALAPAPKLKGTESVKTVLKQDYYYDSWAGRIIKIDSEVQQ